MNAQNRMIAAITVAGLALLAALWFTTISPKREQSATVRASVAEQEQRLDAAQAQLASFASARTQFPGMLAELRRLDKAVPARGAISALLRQVQTRARVSESDLRIASLKSASATSGARAGAPGTPGATLGPGGLSALPFSFEYTGRYFDLLDILTAVRQAVRVRSGDLKIDGRLLTIDGVAFKRPEAMSSTTKAVVNATAYFAPEGASSQVLADAAVAAPTQGGS